MHLCLFSHLLESDFSVRMIVQPCIILRDLQIYIYKIFAYAVYTNGYIRVHNLNMFFV